jgi:hypothetical protein
MENEKNTDEAGMEGRIKTTTVVGVLRAIGWTAAAQLIISLVAFLLIIPLKFLIQLKMASFWFQDASGYQRIAGELLITIGFNSTLSLVLLLATRHARSLNRSMILVVAGWGVWHLLNAPLPILGMKPILCDSFFFYNKRELSGWLFSTGLLFKAVSQFVGIGLYLLWERRRNQGKPNPIQESIYLL